MKRYKRLIASAKTVIVALAVAVSAVPYASAAGTAPEEKTAPDAAADAVLPSEVQDHSILRLHYDEPAIDSEVRPDNFSTGYAESGEVGWKDRSLPLGNGYFGASVFGGVPTERIQLTEQSLFNKTTGYYNNRYAGGMLNFAEVYMDFPGQTFEQATDYERGLSLNDSLADVGYTLGGVDYQREYFTSYPDRVMMIKLTASGSENLDFTLHPRIPNLRDYYVNFDPKTGKGDGGGRTGTVNAEGDTITLSGRLNARKLDYGGQIKVIPAGGTMIAANDENGDNGTITVSGADSAVIVISVGSAYVLSPTSFGSARNANFLSEIKARVSAAAEKGYDAVKNDHLADYRGLFGRVSLDLGGYDDGRTTDVLVDTVADYFDKENQTLLTNTNREPYLEQLYFQYGRYLLISSSRKGSLPGSLQGVWNAYYIPPWMDEYAYNVNMQANYWPAFVANLSDMFESYNDFNLGWRKLAEGYASSYVKNNMKENYTTAPGSNGWSMGAVFTPYDGNAPGGHTGPGAGGFTTAAYADWYQFTKDESRIQEIYSTMQELARFYVKCVKNYGTEEDPVYLAVKSSSPEQLDEDRKPYATTGCAFDQQMIYNNNKAVLDMYHEYGTTLLKDVADTTLIGTIEKQIDYYEPVIVGYSGQVKEYRDEKYYGEYGEPRHRHISQLVGLFPGTVINGTTPAWVDAAAVSLQGRGMGSQCGWSDAHKLNLWARVGDSEACTTILNNLLKKHIFHNLWNKHDGYASNRWLENSAFQIEGNMGATAGMCEMLIQSHGGYIDILPALPHQWATGSFTGLMARGNFEVDTAWKDSIATQINIKSNNGGTCTVHYLNISKAAVKTSDGQTVKPEVIDKDKISFPTTKGQSFVITDIPPHNLSARPTGLKAVISPDGAMELTWTPAENAAGGTTYTVYRAFENSPTYETLAAGVSGPAYEDATRGTRQCTYKVTAAEPGKEESLGALKTVIPSAAAPENVTGFYEGDSLQIQWSPAELAESYEVYEKTGEEYIKLGETPDYLYLAEPADQSKKYYVACVREGGRGAMTEVRIESADGKVSKRSLSGLISELNGIDQTNLNETEKTLIGEQLKAAKTVYNTPNATAEQVALAGEMARQALDASKLMVTGESIDLTTGKPITVTPPSTSAEHLDTNINDGKTGTRYFCGQANPTMSFEIDLKGKYNVRDLKLVVYSDTNQKRRVSKLSAEACLNGEWRSVLAEDMTGASLSGDKYTKDFQLPQEEQAEKLRITCVNDGALGAGETVRKDISIYEFTAYGKAIADSDVPENSTELAYLLCNGRPVTLEEGKRDYTIVLEDGAAEAALSVKPKHPAGAAKLSGGRVSLTGGMGSATAEVTAKDGSKSEYRIQLRTGANVLLNKPVTVTPPASGAQYAAEKMNDGDLSAASRYDGGDGARDVVAEFDLGGLYEVGSFSAAEYGGGDPYRTDNLSVWSSEDGSTWELVSTGGNLDTRATGSGANAYYRRTFQLPRTVKASKLRLRFENTGASVGDQDRDGDGAYDAVGTAAKGTGLVELEAYGSPSVAGDGAVLAALSCNDKAVALEAGKTEYSIELPKGSTEGQVQAQAGNGGSVTLTPADGRVILTDRKGTATVTVRGKDGSEKAYTLKIVEGDKEEPEVKPPLNENFDIPDTGTLTITAADDIASVARGTITGLDNWEFGWDGDNGAKCGGAAGIGSKGTAEVKNGALVLKGLTKDPSTNKNDFRHKAVCKLPSKLDPTRDFRISFTWKNTGSQRNDGNQRIAFLNEKGQVIGSFWARGTNKWDVDPNSDGGAGISCSDNATAKEFVVTGEIATGKLTFTVGGKEITTATLPLDKFLETAQIAFTTRYITDVVTIDNLSSSQPEPTPPPATTPEPTPEPSPGPVETPGLSGLTVDGNAIEVDPAQTDYKVIVPEGTASVQLAAAAKGGTVTRNPADGRVTLINGAGTGEITVNLTAGGTKTYTVSVTAGANVALKKPFTVDPPRETEKPEYPKTAINDGVVGPNNRYFAPKPASQKAVETVFDLGGVYEVGSLMFAEFGGGPPYRTNKLDVWASLDGEHWTEVMLDGTMKDAAAIGGSGNQYFKKNFIFSKTVKAAKLKVRAANTFYDPQYWLDHPNEKQYPGGTAVNDISIIEIMAFGTPAVTVVSASPENAESSAGQLVDGERNTFWQSGTAADFSAAPARVILDTHQTAPVSRVVLTPRKYDAGDAKSMLGRPLGYRIYTADGSEVTAQTVWTQAGSGEVSYADFNSDEPKSLTFTQTSARFIKIEFTSVSDGAYDGDRFVSIAELSVDNGIAEVAEPLDGMQFYHLRGGYTNSYLKFKAGGTARVAFLGGSITENKTGYRITMENYLKKKFPNTKFDFIQAGISSTDSLLGSFRLERDILSKGDLDLLFVEFAVNDQTNKRTEEEQLRGMEGILRHAWQENPNLDIMMMHFQYGTGKNNNAAAIANHERVAEHYQATSLNFAEEVNARVKAGELTWTDFGGTHPNAVGYKIYSDGMTKVLEHFWAEIPSGAAPAPKDLPAQLRADAYVNAGFQNISGAELGTGFSKVDRWNPTKGEPRGGFVDVPTLAATAPGSELSFTFTGTDVGILNVSGPDAGIIAYSVDGGAEQTVDLFTSWSGSVNLPWVVMLGNNLARGEHTLTLRVLSDKNPGSGTKPGSTGTAVYIQQFLVNDSQNANPFTMKAGGDGKLKVTSGTDRTATVIIAGYQGGRLVSFRFYPVTLAADDEQTIDYSSLDLSAADEVRAYAWGDTSVIQPLSTPLKIK